MVYISKMTRAQSRAIDIAFQAQEPKKAEPQDPVYRHMQNIVDKAKRGERL